MRLSCHRKSRQSRNAKRNRILSAADAVAIPTTRKRHLAAGKVVETGGRFVLAVLLARILGADQFGQYTLALATTALGSIGKVGMDSVVRFVACTRETKMRQRLGRTPDRPGLCPQRQRSAWARLVLLVEPIALRIYHEPHWHRCCDQARSVLSPSSTTF